MTIINTIQEWETIGYYRSWANGNGKVFRREFGVGSPTINSLMIECGYAFDSKEDVIEWLGKMGFEKIDIPPCEYLYFDDFDKIKNYSDLSEVYQYLDSKDSEPKPDIFLPSHKYLPRKDISEEKLLNFEVRRKQKSLLNKLWGVVSK